MQTRKISIVKLKNALHKYFLMRMKPLNWIQEKYKIEFDLFIILLGTFDLMR